MRISKMHPNPEREGSLYTTFINGSLTMKDVKGYAFGPPFSSMPDSEPLWFLYDEYNRLIGFQTIGKPLTIDPAAKRDPTVKSLLLPDDVPTFPKYEVLKHLLRKQIL